MIPGNTSLRPAKVALVGLVLGLPLAAGAPGAQARPTAPPTSCGVLTSLHWSSRTAGGTLSGTRYTVAARGFSCALAVKLVPALIKQSGTP